MKLNNAVKAALAKKDAQFAASVKAIAAYQAQVADLTAQIAARDTTIATLHDEDADFSQTAAIPEVAEFVSQPDAPTS